jgi:hypothetical protein
MSRRASVPPADELFRKTTAGAAVESAAAAQASVTPRPTDLSEVIELRGNQRATGADLSTGRLTPVRSNLPATPSADLEPVDRARVVRAPVKRRGRAGEARPTGRTLHEEKITVYVSPEELVDLEQAKLSLRANHGLAVDRGRIVREATALVVADLEARGEESVLVRRLRGL